jgi:hypothetical protein
MAKTPSTKAKKILPTDAILPIKPEFMELIVSGQKNYEYRKYLMDGVIRIWLYEIAPISAITHMMETSNPKTPGEVQDPTGIGNDDFDKGLKKSGQMYKCNTNKSPLLVILDPKKQVSILTQSHEELEHKGEFAVFELSLKLFSYKKRRST